MSRLIQLAIVLAAVLVIGLLAVVLLLQYQAQSARADLAPTPQREQDSSGRGASGANPTGQSTTLEEGSSTTTQGAPPGAVPIGSNMSAEEWQKSKQQAETQPLPPCENMQSDSAETGQGESGCP